MAFVRNEEEEEEKLGSQQPAQGAEQVLSSGGTNLQTPGQGGATNQAGQSPNDAPGQKKGTGWTNLVSYVDANKPQAQAMAQKITGNVANQGAAAANAGTAFQTAAKDTITQQTPKGDDSILTDLAGNASKIANDEARTKQFEAMKNATYQGPSAAQDAEGYTQAQSQYQGVNQSADALEDFEGRRKTVADAYDKRTDYTAGESRLDSFLVGQGGARDTILDAKAKYGADSDFSRGWGDLLTGIDSEIGTAQGKADAIKTATDAALQKGLTGSESSMNAAKGLAKTANDANTKVYDSLRGQLGSKDGATRALAYKQIGLDNETGEWLRSNGYSMADLVAAGKQRAAADFANQSDLDQYSAINKLAGKNTDSGLLTKTGNSDNPYVSNQDKMNAGKEARILQSGLEARLKTQQAQRDAEHSQYADALTSFKSGPSAYSADPLSHVRPLADLAGIDAATLAKAQEKGLDLSGFLTKGKSLNIGDVATDKERSGWAGLLGKLGIAPKYATNDHQDEGAAYGFDKDGLAAAVNAALAVAPTGTASAGNQQQDHRKVLEALAEQEKATAKTLAVAVPKSGVPQPKAKKYF